ncbi:MAG: hypothetical protein LBD73_02690, partial [Deferribacteraceae bacterium]|nr:hypothetical protein [Deferribacteraceae bacterium]
MENADVLAIQTRIEAVLATLNEYQRRRYLSAEAKSIGYGGISLISRRPGGGRKPVRETQPGIPEALEGTVSA